MLGTTGGRMDSGSSLALRGGTLPRRGKSDSGTRRGAKAAAAGSGSMESWFWNGLVSCHW